MDNNIKWLILRICVDVLSLILVFLPFFVLELGIKPYQRGFFCDDDSIRYPYKDDTVTTLVVTLVGLLVPVAVIIVTEVVRYFYARKLSISLLGYRLSSSCFVPHYVVCGYKAIGIFLFGCAVTQSITNIGKYTIGRLRPHFLDVCRPDTTMYQCTNVNSYYVYVENFTCTGTDEHLLQNARLSFPSGHSSMASYCAVFLMIYLQARFTWHGSKLLKHFTQVCCIYGAVFVCLSRISDYKHHWSDVLSGAVIGTFVAALTGLHIISISHLYPSQDKLNIEDGASSKLNIEDGASSGFMLSAVAHDNHRQETFATP